MDIARVTEKYTGHRIDLEALLAAHRGDPVAKALDQALERAANAISETETELTRIVAAVNDSTAKVTENITRRRRTAGTHAQPPRRAAGPRAPVRRPDRRPRRTH